MDYEVRRAQGGLSLLVAQETNPARRSDRLRRRPDLESLLFSQVELSRLPHGFERVGEPHDRGVALDDRAVARPGQLVEGSQSAASVGEAFAQPLHKSPSRSTLPRISGEAALRSTMSTS
jgi:hypothetical protein